MKVKPAKRVSYEEQRAKCVEFIKNFEDYDTNKVDDHFGRSKYMLRLVHSLQFSKLSLIKN